MLPVYQNEDSAWYYTLNGAEFGPYDTKDSAMQSYENHIAMLPRCPTCED